MQTRKESGIMLTCTACGDGVNAFVALDTHSHTKNKGAVHPLFVARRPARGPQPTGLLDNRLLTTLQGELTGTRLLVILRLTAVSKRLVVNTMP